MGVSIRLYIEKQFAKDCKESRRRAFLQELREAAFGVYLDPWFPADAIEAMAIIVEGVNTFPVFVEFVCPPDNRFLQTADVESAKIQLMRLIHETIMETLHIKFGTKVGYAPAENTLGYVGMANAGAIQNPDQEL